MEPSNGRPFGSFDLSPAEIEAEKKERGAAWGNIARSDSGESKPLKWREVNALKFPELPWRVKNLIPLEGFVILSAVSGGGKSWLALELARCICTGENFLGREEFATQKGKVLYIDAENPKSEIQRRGRQLGYADENDFSILSQDSINLNDESEFFRLKLLIEAEGYDAVFVDTMRAVAGSLKEEKAEEVRAFFNRFKPFKDIGVAVIFLDHFRKPSNFDGKVPKKEFLLGSIDKVASCEVLLMLQSEPGSPEINVYQRKNRSSREIAPFQIVMMDEMYGESTKTRFTYNGELVDEISRKEEAKELALGLLESAANGMTSKELLERTRKEVGQKNMRSALKELVSEGLLDYMKSGKQNLYFVPKKENPPEESLVKDELEELFNSG